MAHIVCDDCKKTMLPRDPVKDTSIAVVTFNEDNQPVHINHGTLVYCPGCGKTVIACSGFGTTKTQYVNVVYQAGFEFIKVQQEEEADDARTE